MGFAMNPTAIEVVEAAMAGEALQLEARLFATSAPAEMVRLLDVYCTEHLGRDALEVLFYRRGVGAVFGLRLVDGTEVVVKVHRPELVGRRLHGVWRVQQHLADVGSPAPRPLASPTTLGLGIATAEELVDRGVTANAHHPAIRMALARELHAFIAAATPLLPQVELDRAWPFSLPGGRLWPIPHDLRFDFSVPGGEWIDRLAAIARERLSEARGVVVIGHTDWRVENLRLEGERVVAIFDWDSVAVAPEPAFVGHNAGGFTADWTRPKGEILPSLAESQAFLEDYAVARGRPFTAAELETADAAHLYALAYGARCEHSDTTLGLFSDRGDDTGWRGVLRARGELRLFRGR
jgi:hypothetical protein